MQLHHFRLGQHISVKHETLAIIRTYPESQDLSNILHVLSSLELRILLVFFDLVLQLDYTR